MTPAFSFVERPSGDFYSVRIAEGEFADAIVTYGAVSVREENGRATLKFTFKLEEPSEKHSIDELNASTEFKNVLGDVLSKIMTEAMDSGKFRIGPPKNEPRHPDDGTPKARD